MSQEIRYDALREASGVIVSQADLKGVIESLARFLPSVVSFEFLSLVLYDAERQVFRLHAFGGRMSDHPEVGTEIPVTGASPAIVLQDLKPIVINDIEKETRFPEIVERARGFGVRSMCLLPLLSPRQKFGVLVFGTTRQKDYDAEDLKLMSTVAAHVAVAVENALNFGEARSYQQLLTRERDRLRLVLKVNNRVISHLELGDLFKAVSSALRECFQHDYTGFWLLEQNSTRLRCLGLDFPNSKGFIEKVQPPDLSVAEFNSLCARVPKLFTKADLDALPPQIARSVAAEGIVSMIFVPLASQAGPLGGIVMGSTNASSFGQEEFDLLTHVGDQVALAVENALAYKRVSEARNKLASEKLYLEEEIRREYNLEDIIGRSPALEEALNKAKVVAGTDATVLLLGETGTGKELMARLLHNLSPRRDFPFTRLNCAAIPSGLVESELFGHERGAFTGALSRKLGRFELADHGTLFLDEVGDIPLDLQPKLLRALQEQEFERLGSVKTQRVDVRLIAATNRNLDEMVARKEFREDLYYRLAVFPIQIPSLRERREDIPLLVEYFVARYARRMNKQIRAIPPKVRQAMLVWPWPGNIRELQNFVERAVILTQGETLQAPLRELVVPPKPHSSIQGHGLKSLKETERDAIVEALKKTRGRVGGSQGAAALLGLKRTTLQNKMKRLRITPADY